MSYGRALYYPHIHILDERWIKVASLFYDGLSRIVPEGMRTEDSRIVQVLNSELDFIRDLDPSTSTEDAASDFLGFANKYLADATMRVRLEHDLRELVDESLGVRIHAQKLSDHLREELPRLGLASHAGVAKGEHWDHYDFRPVTGAMYMACLANRLATHHSLPLVSDSPTYQRLIRGAQDDAVYGSAGYDQGYLLGSAVIESAIPENLDAITVDKIVRFRKRHEGERHRFYDAVSALAADIPKLEDEASLRDCINHHARTIQDSANDVRASLIGMGISCTSGFLGLSVPAWAVHLSSAAPQLGVEVAAGGVLTMACGTIAKEGFNYYKARRNSPYSYIVSLNRQLRRKFFGRLTDGLSFL